jgi:hypothetical protein
MRRTPSSGEVQPVPANTVGFPVDLTLLPRQQLLASGVALM